MSFRISDFLELERNRRFVPAHVARVVNTFFVVLSLAQVDLTWAFEGDERCSVLGFGILGKAGV